MNAAPSNINWAWLGTRTVKDIACRATQESEPASWLKHAYAWIYARLDASRRRNLPRPIAEPRGPSAGMVPVLGATSTGTGCLGFVAVRFESTSCTKPTDDMECAVQEAAEAVADVFRRLDFNLGYPHWRIDAWQGGGRSVGLSTVVASLISLLSLSVREDFAATGCYASGEGLSPVPPDSLSAKLKAAKRWGYQRILVVEGQTEIPTDFGLEFVEIPRDLAYALFAILREVADEPGAQAVARLLAVFDQTVVRADPRDQDLDHTLRMTGEFVDQSKPALVRHVAHDIRGRALLHAGRTAEAAAERELADSLRPGALEFPSGWLGEYLKWHQVAHHAVLALDQGRWDDDEPEHRRTLNLGLRPASRRQLI